MSGLEVAGLVLGSLPLLISALEHYAEGVGTIKRMIRYKGEVKILQRELKVEYDLFCNTLEQLLDGIVASPGPFLDDPFGHLWKDADFDKKLQGRLRVSYAGYVSSSGCYVTDSSKTRF